MGGGGQTVFSHIHDIEGGGGQKVLAILKGGGRQKFPPFPVPNRIYFLIGYIRGCICKTWLSVT